MPLASYTIFRILCLSSAVWYSLQERNGGDPIPMVVRTCVEYLEQEGLEVEGIFRRTTGQGAVKQAKIDLNEGKSRLKVVQILFCK